MITHELEYVKIPENQSAVRQIYYGKFYQTTKDIGIVLNAENLYLSKENE